jgi:hypothetical protein
MSVTQQPEPDSEKVVRVARAARLFAFGVVVLVTLFNALWAGIGNSKYRNYESPTTVHISDFVTATSYH